MKIHIVKNGDSLYALSQKYNVELEKLIAANPQIADPNELMVGAKVKIPLAPKPIDPPSDYLYKHVVSQGDTLWKLGKAWSIPLSDMVAANPHLKNPNVLMTGDVVYIPKMKPEGAENAGHPKKDTSVITPEAPLPVEAAPISEVPLAPNLELPELPNVPSPAAEAPAVEAPAPMPNENAMPSYEAPAVEAPAPMPNENAMPSYEAPAVEAPAPMPNANAGVLPSYDMMPQPNAGVLPSYDMMPQPNAGVLPSYDMMPQPNAGVLPSYDMMPQPNAGVLPSYDMMPQPNAGVLPSYDMMPQPNAGVLPAYDAPQPNWGAIDFGVPQASMHPFEQFQMPAAEVMAAPHGKGKENDWHEPELPNAPFPFDLEPAAELPFYSAPQSGFPGYPQAVEPWAAPAGDCGCGGTLNLPYALPQEGFPPVPPVPDAAFPAYYGLPPVPSYEPYAAQPFGYGAGPMHGAPFPCIDPYAHLPGYPGLAPFPPQWAGPAAELPYNFEAPFGHPEEHLPKDGKSKGKKGKGSAELPAAKGKRGEERAVIAQSTGAAAVREVELEDVVEEGARAKAAAKPAPAPKRRSRESQARAALAALIERSNRRSQRAESSRKARPWLND
ncbi:MULTISPECIES: LysM peptidoglycan-binding domain-containing protein [Paenibacillus]|uniref:LysM peptidoglycan-binding domain-containing protein n=1 Tax=Paenibacillus TaxID=44249 RepID=UPI0022B928D6|nr:LysM peptidoglycan-binding domain-containing protein [Paenibacillus caseinilyticus]MCZ8519065.1 LysM peptidoglycan-binding domain-containing protein [Paenibacillus caseinilyticus]